MRISKTQVTVLDVVVSDPGAGLDKPSYLELSSWTNGEGCDIVHMYDGEEERMPLTNEEVGALLALLKEFQGE
jgi:hypothetical protein